MTRRRVVCASVIALASLILFSVTAHSPDFNNFDEGAYAEVAREMAVSGRLLTPRCNGVPYLEKPPLVYWLCAASFRAFGCTTFAGRLPVVLFGVLGVAALFWLLALWDDERAAVFGSVCLASSFGYAIYARTLLLEIPLTALFAAAMLTFFAAFRHPRRVKPLMLATAALLGLAVMVKGLVGLAVPALALFAATLFSRDLRGLVKTMPWASMAVVFLAVAAPWHVMVELRHPGAMAHYVSGGQVLRFLATRKLDVVTLGVGAYLAVSAIWFLPWLFFLPPALKTAIRDVGRGVPERELLLGALAWTAAALGFFAISPARLEYYSLPALPGMAIVVGYWWSRAAFPSRAARNSFIAILLVAALGWLVVLVHIPPPVTERLYALLNEHYRNLCAPAGAARVQPCIADSFSPIAALLTALSAAGMLGFLAERNGRKTTAFAGVVALALVSAFIAHRGLEIVHPYVSVAPLARKASAMMREDDYVAVAGPYENVSPVDFYTRRRALVVDGFGGDLRFGRRLDPSAARWFIDDAQLRKLWTNGRRILLLIPNDASDPSPPTPAWRLAQQPAGSLYSNRP